MTAHSHTVITPGCYRCELNLDEVREAESLEAQRLAREAACPGHDWEQRQSKWGRWKKCRLCWAEDES